MSLEAITTPDPGPVPPTGLSCPISPLMISLMYVKVRSLCWRDPHCTVWTIYIYIYSSAHCGQIEQITVHNVPIDGTNSLQGYYCICYPPPSQAKIQSLHRQRVSNQPNQRRMSNRRNGQVSLLVIFEFGRTASLPAIPSYTTRR